jgi:ABC-type amino acid transport substrate-binding protein
MFATLKAGTLIVASAYPDPPFDVSKNGDPSGFDIDLMRAICNRLNLSLQPVRYEGADFNGIFQGLSSGRYDAVISGTTVTPERMQMARFSEPYLVFGQGVAVNLERSPSVHSLQDLQGLIAGIQQGNTSDAVARRLVAEHILASIRYYPYNAIEQALDDLESGRIGVVIKLFPVLSHLVANRSQLRVVLQVPTNEKIAIAVATTNIQLCDAIDGALHALQKSGVVGALRTRWSL